MRHRDVSLRCPMLATHGWLQSQQSVGTSARLDDKAPDERAALTSVTKQVCLFLFQTTALFLTF